MDSIKQNSQTVLSIGPGQLGIERGIESTGTRLRVAAYVEIETFVIANLIGLMEKGVVAASPIWADLKTFDPQPFHNKLHGIIAGYPCQPFSVAGNRKGADDPRHLWPYIEAAIKATRPVWCFFENVEGHLSLGFDKVYGSLQSLGYRVEAGIFSASEVGAPHQRKRLFILAVSKRAGKLVHPQSGRSGRLANTGSPWKGHGTGGSGELPQPHREGQLANPSKSGFRGQHPEGLQPQAQRDSKGKMANAKFKGFQRCGGKHEFSKCSKEVKTGRKCSNVSDPLCFHGGEEWDDPEAGQSGTASTGWPAGPGSYQHGWEEGRTFAKSSMGCTIDGYNFREDLLRLFGNGVVSQTAAKGWMTLWNKHQK